MPFFAHPLLGFGALPRLPALLERADPDAAALLLRARQLAAARIAAHTALAHRLVELHAPPWSQPAREVPRERAWVTPSDVVRALLVGPDHGVLDAVLGGLELGGVDEARARLGDSIAHAVPADAPTHCHPAWARRWALALLHEPELRIDVGAVLGSLGAEGCDAFASLTTHSRDGLWTRDEARQRMWLGLDRAQARRWPDMLPLYFDRHGGLAALDVAQRSAPVTLVVAPDSGQGRQALVRAWIARLRTGEAGAALAQLAMGEALFNIGHEYSAGDLAEHGLTPGARVFALAPDGWRKQRSHGEVNGVGLGSGVGWLDRVSVPELRRVFAAAHAARAAPQTYRVILTLTGPEAAALASAMPETQAFPRVDVSSITPRDALGLWLSRLPWLTDPPTGVAAVLEAFSSATEAEQQAFDLDAISSALAHPRPPARPMRWRAFVRAAAAGTARDGKWPVGLRELAERYTGDIDGLAALVAPLSSFPFGEADDDA